MLKQFKKSKGFTLIELIVVIAILAILVLLALPRFLGQTTKATEAQIKNDIRVTETKVSEHLIHNENLDDWEIVDENELNNLVSEGVLYKRSGLAKSTLEGKFSLIPSDFISSEIGSALNGNFYSDNEGNTYYEHDKSLDNLDDVKNSNGYTEEEIDDLINNGYIPIATSEELQHLALNSQEERIFGEGTKWERTAVGDLSEKYIQVNNIDLSDYTEGEGWNPIGSFNNEFKGKYNGGNFKINGLVINRPNESSQGLFGNAAEAEIENVALENVNIIGDSYVGGLVGEVYNVKINNSYTTGNVIGDSYVGGLVGTAYKVAIDNSYTTGNIDGEDYVGGLVGDAYIISINNSYTTGDSTGNYTVAGLVGFVYEATIDNSYATGNVTANESLGGLLGSASETIINNSYATGDIDGDRGDAGGLVGHAHDNTTIVNSYATGNVNGSSSIGGLVGETWESLTIIDSYATGNVTGDNFSGGLLGNSEENVNYSEPSVVINSYYDIQTTGQNTSALGLGEGKTTEEMQQQETFEGWDFESIWQITPGSYPNLR